MNQRAKQLLSDHLPAPAKNGAKKIRDFLYPSGQSKKAAFQNPTVLTDAFGIRFVYYPWEASSLADLMSRDFYKPEFYAVKKLVHENDTVIDVGANIGLHSAFISNIVGIHGHIHAFEPVPHTYWMLRETLTLNRASNVTSNMMALGDKKATLKMNVFEEQYSAWNTFGKQHFDDVKPIGSVDVAVTTLDEYCEDNKITRIQFLKIDVEGFELEVLRGSKKMLDSGKVDSLSFEISQIPLEGSGGKAKDIFDILQQHGYKSYKFNVEANKFEGPYTDSNEFYENYYASREDLSKL